MNGNLRGIGPRVAVVLLVAACGGSSEAERSAPPANSPVAVDSGAVTDSVGSASSAEETGEGTTPAAADPFTGFELDAGPSVSEDLRRLSLMLRNDAPTMAIVHADGGAGEVLLDSVPPGSRQRVDVLTRAPVVTLRATTLAGHALRATEVAVGPDTIVEVLVGGVTEP